MFYTLGFLRYKNHVLLIRKNKPDWQRGFLNGLGGRIEDSETIEESFIREVQEEAGIQLDFNEIERAGTLRGPEWFVYLFRGETIKIYDAITNSTEGRVLIKSISELDAWKTEALPNLGWIIPCIFYKEKIIADYTYVA